MEEGAKSLDRAAIDVDYDHNQKFHTVSGARAALEVLFNTRPPESVLDVGCGHGTWLRAAIELGVRDICGIDGAAISYDDLLFPEQYYRSQDLREPWDLERRFDAIFCLEVAEHLPAEAAPKLIGSLVKHADIIFFSAAAPGQPGQHHVNCQWPEYWQNLFNMHGYECSDALRWMIWGIDEIEWWYRQNLFQATYSPNTAGTEARIKPVVHPEMLYYNVFEAAASTKTECISRIERGNESALWYVSLLYKIALIKLKRMLRVSKKMVRPIQKSSP